MCAQVREWVEHHARLGVGKFYITDTGSAEPLGRQIRDHIASGLVDYFYRCARAAAGSAWRDKSPSSTSQRNVADAVDFRTRMHGRTPVTSAESAPGAWLRAGQWPSTSC